MLVENNISSNINSDKILLSVQDASRFLGVPKKVIQDLIDTGLLKAVNASGKTYISRYALSEVTGEKSVAHFGQLASGQTIENTIYYSQQSEFTDCEDDSMFVKRYTGSVSALKDGAYMAQIDMGRTSDGKRLRPSKRFKKREEAERYLNQRLAELNGEYIHQQNPVPSNTTLEASNALYTDMTFEEYAKMILNRGIGKAVSRTIDGYRISLVPVLESIGNIKMVDIDRDKLISTFNKLSYRYGKVSLKKAYNTTKMIMEEAYYNELIPKNPFIRLKMPASKVEIENYRLPYSDEEIALVLKKSKVYCNKILYPMICVLECTGMRPGELRAMEWKNIDFDKKTVDIKHAVIERYDVIKDLRKKPKSYEVIGPTKSASGVRRVGLSDLTIQALLDWRKELNTMPVAMRDSIYVFPNEKGEFRSASSNKCLIQRFVKKAGIQDMHFMLYRFRHTVCTRMFLEGLSIQVVQQMLGDNTSTVVTSIYNHMTQEQALSACDEYYDRINQKNAQKYILD